MTDGPFKNAKLTREYKKFGNSLDNDAMSRDERTERVESALSRDLCPEFRELLQELDAYTKRPQLDIEPRSSVEAIFDKHPKSPLADSLQRNFMGNLARPMEMDVALNLAFDSTIKREQHNIRNRMIEEATYARERKDLPASRYGTVIERLTEAVNGISLCRVRADAFNKKTASRAGVTKKSGLDDGPSI